MQELSEAQQTLVSGGELPKQFPVIRFPPKEPFPIETFPREPSHPIGAGFMIPRRVSLV